MKKKEKLKKKEKNEAKNEIKIIWQIQKKLSLYKEK